MLGLHWASLVAQIVKNLPAMRETQVWSPVEENDYPLRYSGLENSTDRGAWRATVHGVAKSQTLLWGVLSSCSVRGLLSCSRAQAPGFEGFSSWGWGLGSCCSQALQHRLNSCDAGLSCSQACGTFPDQGLNPCLLHWQVDSLPLNHQGNPWKCF